MIPGLWSILPAIHNEFPEHLFTLEICFLIGLAVLTVNVAWSVIFDAPFYIDLSNQRVPGPRAHYINGNLQLVRKCFSTHRVGQVLSELASKYGQIFMVRWPYQMWLVVNDVDAFKATVSEPDRFQHIDKYSLLAEGFGQVSIAKNASARQRIVHGIESLPSFQAELLTVCHQHAEEMCGHWRSQCATDSKKKIDVAGPLQDTTLRVFFRCATGRDPTEQHITALSVILAECRQRARDLFFIQRYDPRRLLKAWRAVQFMRNEVSKALVRASPDTEALDVLSQMKKATAEAGLTEAEAAYEILHFVLFNYDTVWPALAWTLYELARNPSAVQDIQAELKANVSGAHADDAHAKTSKLEQGLLESVRLHPVVAMQEFITIRIAQVGPYFVPEGLTVLCNVAAATGDPAVWEDSLAFKPQRFATGDVEEPSRELWLPFYRSGPGGKGETPVGLFVAKAVLTDILGSLSPVGPVEEKQHVQELVCRPFKGMEIPFVHA